MGSNIDGFQNELDLIEYINSKNVYDSYNENIQKFLNFIFDFDLSGENIKCYKEKGQQKPDLSITCKGIKKFISVKKGSGNSVHQESFNDFINFLNGISVSESTIEGIKLYHYGDGTIDDTGKIRFSGNECSSIYSSEIKTINAELNKSNILEIILDRILFLGNFNGGNLTDYVYYGTVYNGIWASREELLEYFLTNQFTSNTIHFASLTYQVWGRNHNFTAKNPDRRYVMQVKWSQIVSDICKIRKEKY